MAFKYSGFLLSEGSFPWFSASVNSVGVAQGSVYCMETNNPQISGGLNKKKA